LEKYELRHWWPSCVCLGWLLQRRLTNYQLIEAGNGMQVSPGSITVERGDLPMKTIISALIIASVFGLVTLPASAFDAKTFFEQQSRQSGGSN
jgi:hypothetical protein